MHTALQQYEGRGGEGKGGGESGGRSGDEGNIFTVVDIDNHRYADLGLYA